MLYVMLYVVLAVVVWYAVAYYGVREWRENCPTELPPISEITAGGWRAMWVCSPIPTVCMIILALAVYRAYRSVFK